MLAAPHPNQVRSACERCRKQKLRCSRQNAPDPESAQEQHHSSNSSLHDHDGSASCVRCTRLGLPCQSGTQRKVGRPTKKDHLARRVAAAASSSSASSPVSVAPSMLVHQHQPQQQHHQQQHHGIESISPARMHLSPDSKDSSNIVILRSQSLSATAITATTAGSIVGEDDSVDSGISIAEDMSWLPMVDAASPGPAFDFASLDIPVDGGILPPGLAPTPPPATLIFPLTQSLPLPDAAGPSTSVAPMTTPDVHFQTLSRINFDLHSTWDAISRQNVVITLETLVSGICGHLSSDVATGMKAMQTIIKASQEFLVTIRALQRRLSDEGARRRMGPASSSAAATANTANTGTGHNASSNHNNNSDPSRQYSSKTAADSSSSSSSSSSSTTDAGEAVSLGSPTALLIISVFCQLCAHFDLIFTIVNTRLSEPDAPAVSPGDVFFADIQILDFASLGSMFTELIRTVMAQILPVLGFPPECAAPGLRARQGGSHHHHHHAAPPMMARGSRPGLLVSGRWREVLNGELGGPQMSGWSMRPAQTLEMMEVARELLMEYALGEKE